MQICKAKWLEVFISWTTFEKQSYEVHILDNAIFSTTREFVTKEDLSTRKQVLVLKLRFW